MPNFPVFVVDIDITIADLTHREELLVPHCEPCGKPSWQALGCATCAGTGGDFKVPQHCWDAFLDASLLALDEPVPEAQRVINYLYSQGASIWYITGRNEGLREATEEWLRKHFHVPDGHLSKKLLMRPLDSKDVPASVHKRTQVEWLISWVGRGESIVFFEDDPYVHRLYAEYGLVLSGPECWASMCPPGLDPHDEESWRK